MSHPNQLCFTDGLLSARRKSSKQAAQLQQIDTIVDWEPQVKAVIVMDKTSKKTGGRPRINPLWMIKTFFLQHLFNISDPQLEDQMMYRLNLQQSLIAQQLDLKIFELISQQLTEQLISYDEKRLFADKAYADGHLKDCALQYGWYYGILDKATRGQKLSASQHKCNAQRARVRAAVEHPFAWLKSKANFGILRAKSLLRNQLAFIFGCIGCNLSRALYLPKKQRVTLA